MSVVMKVTIKHYIIKYPIKIVDIMMFCITGIIVYRMKKNIKKFSLNRNIFLKLPTIYLEGCGGKLKNRYGLRYHSGEIFSATPVKCWQMIAWAVQVCSSL